ncbi:galectin-3-like [Contarinia nasturtii]|uniref:galectin-3-like n=1 Tax=Contarinia nasturtii TaxID=265458 RepID=UPI0012D46B25|nr:galectin-3-like [Contarinia nasturtii]
MASLHLTINPALPLLRLIPEDLCNGTTIEITGQMLHRDRFCVDFRDGSFVNFHLSVRPCDNKIVRNHKMDGEWQKEECKGGCPIKYGAPFKIVIVVEEDKFKVSHLVNILYALISKIGGATGIFDGKRRTCLSLTRLYVNYINISRP